jgi:hypothetical protein
MGCAGFKVWFEVRVSAAVILAQYNPKSGFISTLQYRAPLLVTDFTEIHHFLVLET